MDVEFVKTGDRSYVVRARRSDGAILETRGSGPSLPHELAHLVVEAGLGMDNGFWGRTARGAEFRSMRVVRTKPYKQPTRANRELAKGFEPWDENLVNALERLYREACARHWRPPEPLPHFEVIPRILRSNGIDVATIAQLCTALFEAHQEWRAIGTGATLRRRWPHH